MPQVRLIPEKPPYIFRRVLPDCRTSGTANGRRRWDFLERTLDASFLVASKRLVSVRAGKILGCPVWAAGGGRVVTSIEVNEFSLHPSAREA